MDLDAATVLLQWATGGLAFTWVTTRRREVGIGYGWLMRGTYLVLAALAVVAGRALSPEGWGAVVRDVGSGGVVLGAAVALLSSVHHRKAGVRGEHERRERRAERVQAMVGDRAAAGGLTDTTPAAREFDPRVDLVAPVLGVVGLVGAASVAGGEYGLALARIVIGAAFLGAVTDAMLLGHWYLVQPGLGRAPLLEMNRWIAVIWPFEVGAMLWSPGMPQVFTGTIDDGWDGLLGWVWVTSAAATIALVGVVRLALNERYYSAVMAATGLLYLAILTGFGTDLVARAVLAP